MIAETLNYRAAVHAPPSMAWPPRLLLLAAVSLALAYGGFFAAHLPPAPMEQAYGTRAGFGILSAGLRALGGLAACRGASIVAAAIALFATAWTGRKATGDWLVGAGLALGWVMFPPLTATFAMATPHAAVAAVTGAGLALAWPERAGPASVATAAWAAPLLLAVAPLIDPSGAWAALLATAVATAVQDRKPWRFALPAMASAIALAATGGHVADDVVVVPPHSGILYAFVLPYGLLVTAIILGVGASFTAPVQTVLGVRGIRASRLAALGLPVTFAAAVALGSCSVDQLLVGMGFFFPASLIAALPLVVWIRFAMPQVRNRAAWILFPVLMYSAFWLALGPVKPDTFPYRLLPKSAPKSGSE